MANSSCIVVNSHSACFDSLTKQERELIDQNKRELIYRKGEIVAKQGAFASHVIFLEEGLVKVYLEGDQQKDLVLKIVPSGHMITLSSIYEGNNVFTYSAAAYIESRVTLYERDVFIEIMNKNPLFASKIVSVLNENANQIYGRFYCMTRKQAHGRVADLLLCLSERVYKSTNFDVPISRQDFAELIGISAESVSRIFREFKDEKLIEAKGTAYTILNRDSLSRISCYG